ncbi:MAG: hypothetical protein H7Y22_19850 [Gemmatimonadaceae bacterium]|nr:hypothetical protein [Gloeobacterales cyanobacterium ES-bin-141]
MTRPDFNRMDLHELKAYMLAHRDDIEAFHAYMDRSDTERPVLAVLEPGESLTEQVLEEVLRRKRVRDDAAHGGEQTQ